MEQHVFKQQQKSTSKFVLLTNYLHSKKVFTTSNPLRSAHVGFFGRGWGWGGVWPHLLFARDKDRCIWTDTSDIFYSPQYEF